MAFFDFPPENRFRIFSGQELLSRSLCVFTMIFDFILTLLKYLSIFLILSLWSMIIFAVFYNIFKVLFV